MLVVCLMAGFLLWDAIWASDKPPNIEIVIASIQPNGSDFLVQFTAYNRGGETVAGVKISAELRLGDGQVETADTTLTYLPAESSREGGIFFQHNPRGGRLRIKPVAYEKA